MNRLIKNNLKETLPNHKVEAVIVDCYSTSFQNNFHKSTFLYANLAAKLICGLILHRHFDLTLTIARLDKRTLSF